MKGAVDRLRGGQDAAVLVAGRNKTHGRGRPHRFITTGINTHPGAHQDRRLPHGGFVTTTAKDHADVPVRVIKQPLEQLHEAGEATAVRTPVDEVPKPAAAEQTVRRREFPTLAAPDPEPVSPEHPVYTRGNTDHSVPEPTNDHALPTETVLATRDEQGELEIEASSGRRRRRREGRNRPDMGVTPQGPDEAADAAAGGGDGGHKEPPPPASRMPNSDDDEPGKKDCGEQLCSHLHIDVDKFAHRIKVQASELKMSTLQDLPITMYAINGIARFSRRQPTLAEFQTFVNRVANPQDVQSALEGMTEYERSIREVENHINIISALDLSILMIQSIKTVKNHTAGEKAITPAVDALSAAFAERIAHHVAFTRYDELMNDLQPMHEITRATEELLHKDDFGSSMAPEIAIFVSELASGLHLATYLKSLEGTEEGVSYEALKEANDNLFLQAQALQRYGIKSAITPAVRGGEWLVLDYETEIAARRLNNDQEGTNFTPMRYAGRHIAQFLATAGHFASSLPQYESHKGVRKSAIYTAIAVDSLFEEGSQPSAIVKLMPDGHLATNFGRPIPELLEEVGGDMRSYEILRAEVLAMFADSVTPQTVTRLVDQELESKAPAALAPETERKQQRKPLLYPLVLARQYVMKVLEDDIVADIEREKSQPQPQGPAQEGEHPKRHMVEHDVVWHLRDLNPRYRASPQARALALEKHGIILPEFGVTYVDSTTRGDLPRTDVKGHKVRQRRKSDTREENEIQ